MATGFFTDPAPPIYKPRNRREVYKPTKPKDTSRFKYVWNPAYWKWEAKAVVQPKTVVASRPVAKAVRPTTIAARRVATSANPATISSYATAAAAKPAASANPLLQGGRAIGSSTTMTINGKKTPVYWTGTAWSRNKPDTSLGMYSGDMANYSNILSSIAAKSPGVWSSEVDKYTPEWGKTDYLGPLPTLADRSSFTDEATSITDATNAYKYSALDKELADYIRIRDDALRRSGADYDVSKRDWGETSTQSRGALANMAANSGMDMGGGAYTNAGNLEGQINNAFNDINVENFLRNAGIGSQYDVNAGGVAGERSAIGQAYGGDIQNMISKLFGDESTLRYQPALSAYSSAFNTALGNVPSLATGGYNSWFNPQDAIANLYGSVKPGLRQDNRNFIEVLRGNLTADALAKAGLNQEVANTAAVNTETAKNNEFTRRIALIDRGLGQRADGTFYRLDGKALGTVDQTNISSFLQQYGLTPPA